MATTTTTITEQQQQLPPNIIRPPTARRVCFSFAAYSKNLIDHLRHSNVPIAEPLNDQEIATIQSTYHFTFPPDLRSILQEGLPMGPGFPNWRSSSSQQLHILTSLPILGLCKQVSRRQFWYGPWCDRPNDDDHAVELAKSFLTKNAPILVPVYRHCYIASAPCLAGNPVFYIDGGDVRLWSYDIIAFFQQTEFKGGNAARVVKRLNAFGSTPAWAATEARRIEFWTELAGIVAAEEEARGDTRAWWQGGDAAVGRTMEGVCWRLREGGWKEEEVREMMMMITMTDGCEGKRSSWESRANGQKDRKALVWHVRLLSMKLLRAGWSTRDVVDSLGLLLEEEEQQQPLEKQKDEIIQIDERDHESCWFDFHNSGDKCVEVQKPSLRQLFNLHSMVEV